MAVKGCTTADDLDCRNCLEWEERKKACGAGCCPYIDERLDADCISFFELVKTISSEIENSGITDRIKKLLRRQKNVKMLFKNPRHQQRWNALLSDGYIDNKSSRAVTACVFLLSSDDFLWSRSKYSIFNESIDFESIDIRGVDCDEYAIFKAVKELYMCEKKGILAELVDPKLINDEIFRLIINSLVVRRYGAKALQKKVAV